MKPSFLCHKHRAMFAFMPERTIPMCSASFQMGWLLYGEERWEEALPHIGCAFEMAEIILTARSLSADRAIKQYLNTTVALAQTLAQLGRVEACKAVYQMAIKRFQRALSEYAEHSEQLAMHVQQLKLAVIKLDQYQARSGDYDALMMAKQAARQLH